jgi:hypothetical protein
MDGLPTNSGSATQPGVDEATAPIPWWVKVTWLVALVVALLLAATMLVGGGRHGPARHVSLGNADAQVPAVVAGQSPIAAAYLP